MSTSVIGVIKYHVCFLMTLITVSVIIILTVAIDSTSDMSTGAYTDESDSSSYKSYEDNDYSSDEAPGSMCTQAYSPMELYEFCS